MTGKEQQQKLSSNKAEEIARLVPFWGAILISFFIYSVALWDRNGLAFMAGLIAIFSSFRALNEYTQRQMEKMIQGMKEATRDFATAMAQQLMEKPKKKKK